MRDQYSRSKCVIMPSYGMTECMPISAPPHDWQLQKPGSCGRAIGPMIQIHNEAGVELPCGSTGHIVVSGSPLMRGYEVRA